jgi:DnaJ-class molecular chaperone
VSNVKWSKAQKASRARFAEAIAYAKQAMADPQVRAHYEKLGKKANRQPFRVAVSDFLAGKNLLENK